MAKVCGTCRHANHGTMDARGGLLACPWAGGCRGHDAQCVVEFTDTNTMAWEEYDGKNCTWGSGNPVMRSAPAGYEHRPVAFVSTDFE